MARAEITETIRNLKKKIQIVKFEQRDLLEPILSLIGPYNVKCYITLSDRSKVGIIGPIEMETSEEELVELLGMSGYKNAKIPPHIGEGRQITKTMKIWLEVDQVPSSLTLMYERVTPFIDKPW